MQAIVTYGPSAQYGDTVGMTIPPEHPGWQVMATRTPMTVSGGLVRGNIMNVRRPIVENDEVVGYIWANELLDALPVHLVVWGSEEAPVAVFERGVSVESERFVWRDRPASGRLLERAQQLTAETELPTGYLSEIGLAAGDWTAAWAPILGHGALLLIDYGFPRHEFYHPQRSEGTLMCHYRHRAHADPFYLPGLQDITAHVDFTAVVEAGHAAGLDFLGYTTQGVFLLNCGLTEVLARTPYEDRAHYLPLAASAQKLLGPSEMGELFKVMALGKGIENTLLGFAQGDRSATL